LGTLFLVLVIKLASANYLLAPEIAIGFGLFVYVYTWGYVSTAHFNPSVTLAFVIRDCKAFPRSDYGQIAMYFISEYMGGLAGGFLAILIGGKSAGVIVPTVADGVETYEAFFAEMIFTWLLATCILTVATDERQGGIFSFLHFSF
jgi:glycerol uptake facilitator-like aquaporin